MADVGSIIDSVSTAVSSVANTVSNLGPNDQGKAVRAAKQAGKYAAKLEGKKWPAWLKKGTKEMAQGMGYNSKAEWQKAKAEAEDAASDEAYKEVWDMYVKAKDAQINGYENQTSQEYLNAQLAAQQATAEAAVAMGSAEMKKSAGSGCMGMSAILLASGGAIAYIVYAAINLI